MYSLVAFGLKFTLASRCVAQLALTYKPGGVLLLTFCGLELCKQECF